MRIATVGYLVNYSPTIVRRGAIIIDNQQIQFAEKMFKLLSNEKRIRILYLLENHTLNVSEISEQLGLPQPSVSHQLALLREYQLVQYHRDGKHLFCKLNLLIIDDYRSSSDNWR